MIAFPGSQRRRKALAPTGTYRLAFPAGERNFHERGLAPAPGRAARRRPRGRPRRRDHWLPGRAAGQPAPGRHRGRHPRPPGGHRRRRDRLGEDHPAAQDLPRARPRVAGQIGHTQPRRIAARTVAERIAEELKTDLGDVVGYKVRFTDKSGDNTAVKLMTDGILLAEIGSDQNLRRYDTLIIDEAHERSLNIDFILGYLRQLLPRRPDLKVIITSATIDPERFAEHFKDPAHRAARPDHRGLRPHLPGRGPLPPGQRPRGPRQRRRPRPGSGHLRRDRRTGARGTGRHPRLPLRRAGDPRHRRRAQGQAQGRRAARSTGGCRPPSSTACSSRRRSSQIRRVVLATNVAETSLTVPGIRYVIDPGTARISRYSLRTKVQRLPIEAISQASANQRKGRCGRVADGICIRLYSQEDFESRPEFTDPEIQRTNLASRHPADGRRPPRRRAQVPVRRPARPARDHRRRHGSSKSSTR